MVGVSALGMGRRCWILDPATVRFPFVIVVFLPWLCARIGRLAASPYSENLIKKDKKCICVRERTIGDFGGYMYRSRRPVPCKLGASAGNGLAGEDRVARTPVSGENDRDCLPLEGLQCTRFRTGRDHG